MTIWVSSRVKLLAAAASLLVVLAGSAAVTSTPASAAVARARQPTFLVTGQQVTTGPAGLAVRPGGPQSGAQLHAAALFDVVTGNNDRSGYGGAVCGYDYLCMAKQGYDAPTGLGTPDGTGAF